jgi:hypothetical protein
VGDFKAATCFYSVMLNAALISGATRITFVQIMSSIGVKVWNVDIGVNRVWELTITSLHMF